MFCLQLVRSADTLRLLALMAGCNCGADKGSDCNSNAASADGEREPKEPAWFTENEQGHAILLSHQGALNLQSFCTHHRSSSHSMINQDRPKAPGQRTTSERVPSEWHPFNQVSFFGCCPQSPHRAVCQLQGQRAVACFDELFLEKFQDQDDLVKLDRI